MSDGDLDDFGGFEVAEPECLESPAGDNLLIDSASIKDASELEATVTNVTNIPWLAASIRATVFDSSNTSSTPVVYSKEDGFKGLDVNFSRPNDAGDTSIKLSTLSEPEKPPIKSTNELVEELKSQLDHAFEEKKLKTLELTNLRLQYETSCKHLEELAEKLSVQQQNYERMTENHKLELVKMKEENEKALAVIIEEYKESNKLGLLQVQENCGRLYNQQLKEQIESIEEILKAQNNKFEEWKERKSRELEEKVDKSLDSIKSEAMNMLEENKKSMANQILEANTSSLDNIKAELLAETKAEIQRTLTQIKSQCDKIIDDATSDLKLYFKTQCSQVKDDERVISLDFWDKHSKDLMEKLHVTLKESMENHRSATNDYIKDRLQADQAAYRKQLSAIDVYLSAAQKHLNSLVEDSIQSQPQMT